ncbi:tyrosine-type recombinase/integrase [Verrucomicrobiota bacterium]
MPLEMRPTSKWWYGRIEVNDKRYCKNLNVEIKGRRPRKLSMPSDRAFEKSRTKAEMALQKFQEEAKQNGRAEELVQTIHKIRTGKRIDSIPLSDLTDEWDAAPRRHKGCDEYVRHAHRHFKRFVAFLNENYPNAVTLADVTPEMTNAFLRHVSDHGVSGRTWNSVLILLRSAFKVLGQKANIIGNPFEGIPTRDENTLHRQPFSPDELKAILDASDLHPFIKPVIVTGISTAMRRGDCCCLRKDEVDLADGFVTVKTSKTGETVDIPMFPMLRDEIRRQPDNDSEYVFPELADMYRTNPHGITCRVKKVLETAGFYDKKPGKTLRTLPQGLKILPAQELRKRVLKELSSPKKPISEKKLRRMIAIFESYVDTKSLPRTARDLGVSKSTVSLHLHEIEGRTGLQVIPRNPPPTPAEHRGDISAEREAGVKRASIRDFHSFRVTWITLALSAGIPLELVQRVTGHKTTEVVLKHYFRPGREDFRQIIKTNMPKLLTASKTPSVPAQTDTDLLEAVAHGLRKQSAKNWHKVRKELLTKIEALTAG